MCMELSGRNNEVEVRRKGGRWKVGKASAGKEQ